MTIAIQLYKIVTKGQKANCAIFVELNIPYNISRFQCPLTSTNKSFFFLLLSLDLYFLFFLRYLSFNKYRNIFSFVSIILRVTYIYLCLMASYQVI